MNKTLKRIAISHILSLALILLALPAFAKPQEACPVLKNPVNKEVYTDYQGKRVYFCCPACIDIFNQEPEKYLQIMEEAGEEPTDSPKD